MWRLLWPLIFFLFLFCEYLILASIILRFIHCNFNFWVFLIFCFWWLLVIFILISLLYIWFVIVSTWLLCFRIIITIIFLGLVRIQFSIIFICQCFWVFDLFLLLLFFRYLFYDWFCFIVWKFNFNFLEFMRF